MHIRISLCALILTLWCASPRVDAGERVADRLARQSGPSAWERPSPNDPALIQYTSGSTGDPKGVLLSHANILANVRAIGEALEIHHTRMRRIRIRKPDDRIERLTCNSHPPSHSVASIHL